MKKFSKKLNLNKREINDLTVEDQVKLEGGTAYTCGHCSGGGGGHGTFGLSGCTGCMGSIGSCQSTNSNCTVPTRPTFGCASSVYGNTCLGC